LLPFDWFYFVWAEDLVGGVASGGCQAPRDVHRRGRLPSFGSYATPEMAVLIAGLFFAGSFLLVRSLTRR
jgi:hypothetical protein